MNYLFERFSSLFNPKKSSVENELIKEVIGQIQLSELQSINQLLEDHYSS